MAAPAVRKQTRAAQERIQQIEASVRRGEPAPLIRVNGTRLPQPPRAPVEDAPLDPGVPPVATRPARSPTFQPLTEEEIAAATDLSGPAAAPVSGRVEAIPTPAAPVDDQETVKYWRDRCLAAEGITKKAKQQQEAAVRGAVAEVEGRFAEELTTLRSENARLQAELDKVPRVINLADHFSPEEIEQLGEAACRKIIERQEKIAQSAVERVVKPLQQELKTTKAATAQVAKKSFYKQLDATVENWRDINTDPRFGEFLEQFNQRAGVTERDLLNLAFNAQDAERVASFFTAFEESLGEPRDPAHRVVPSGNATPTPSTQVPATKTVKRSTISQFQHEVASGKHRRNPQYVQDKMAEFNAAVREGRVVDG